MVQAEVRCVRQVPFFFFQNEETVLTETCSKAHDGKKYDGKVVSVVGDQFGGHKESAADNKGGA